MLTCRIECSRLGLFARGRKAVFEAVCSGGSFREWYDMVLISPWESLSESLRYRLTDTLQCRLVSLDAP